MVAGNKRRMPPSPPPSTPVSSGRGADRAVRCQLCYVAAAHGCDLAATCHLSAGWRAASRTAGARVWRRACWRAGCASFARAAPAPPRDQTRAAEPLARSRCCAVVDAEQPALDDRHGDDRHGWRLGRPKGAAAARGAPAGDDSNGLVMACVMVPFLIYECVRPAQRHHSQRASSGGVGAAAPTNLN